MLGEGHKAEVERIAVEVADVKAKIVGARPTHKRYQAVKDKQRVQQEEICRAEESIIKCKAALLDMEEKKHAAKVALLELDREEAGLLQEMQPAVEPQTTKGAGDIFDEVAKEVASINPQMADFVKMFQEAMARALHKSTSPEATDTEADAAQAEPSQGEMQVDDVDETNRQEKRPSETNTSGSPPKMSKTEEPNNAGDGTGRHGTSTHTA